MNPDIIDPSSAVPCPSCTAHQLIDFFEIQGLPLHVGFVSEDREQARRAPTGDIALAYCRGCGLIHNRKFDVTQLTFEPGYEVALHHSPVFRAFTEDTIRRLMERYELQQKKIFEIGCGAGYFLKHLCEWGANAGVGIDPTVEQEGTFPAGQGSVRFVRDFFTDRFLDESPDFICCVSVFEDIPEPIEFLQRVKRMIGGRNDVPVYFEVFNAYRAFEERETWSIHCEQCNYFSLASLVELFERCGFRVLDSATCYQSDQYLYVEATTTGGEAHPPPPRVRQVPDVITKFSDLHRRNILDWTARLDEFDRQDRKVVLWGSGGKGISFLNSLPTEGRISYVVDINPDRQDRYVPGTAHRIVPPEFLTEYGPDVVILSNRLYESEIRQQVQQMNVDCEFLVA